VTREVTFAGDEGRLTISVLGYEFPDDASGIEANWLSGGARLELSATGGFRCSCPVLFMADELSFFRDDLGRVLAREKGNATLETEEDRICVSVDIEGDLATLSGYIRVDGFARLGFEKISTDSASLRLAHADLADLVRAFPVRTFS
jgi:hypothetical protein